jgi:hypothetical protein
MKKFSKQYKDSQNKSKWISNKIDKLVSEGKPKNQAIAISNAMWNSRMRIGGSFGGNTGPGDPPSKYNPFGEGYDPFALDNEIKRRLGLVQNSSNRGDPTNQSQKNIQYPDGMNFPSNDPSMYEGAPMAPFENVVDTPQFQSWADKNLGIKPMPTSGKREQIQPMESSMKSQGIEQQGITTEAADTFFKDNQNPYGFNEETGRGMDFKEKEGEKEDDTKEDDKKQPMDFGIPQGETSSFYNLGQAVERGNGVMIAGSAVSAGLSSARNFFSGMGQARSQQDAMDERRRKEQEEASGVNNVKAVSEEGGEYSEYGYGGEKKMYKAEGGEVDQDRILTGEVLTGVSGNNQSVEPNTEIEDGEYVMSKDGQSIKVEGKKHSQGGEDVELQEGDKVISDKLKLKGSNAKAVRDMFDIKAKAKDTYATVVDRVYKKIGLEKLIKEQEQVISRIRQQEEKLGESATKNLNLELLYKKKDKIQGEKDKLEEQRQGVLNEVYNMQEASKEPKEGEQAEMAYGGEVDRPKNMMQDAGEVGEGEEDFTEENEKAYASFVESLKDIPSDQPLKEINGFRVYDNITKGDFLETIKNNPWYNFTDFQPTKEKTEDFQEQYNKRIGDGTKLVLDGKFGDDTAGAFLPLTDENNQNPYGSNEETGKGEKEEVTEEEEELQGFQGRPDQSVLPPTGVDAQLKANTRYDRVNPNLMSPDQMIQENERRAAASIKMAQQLPDAQRASVIAQITAQTQLANQKVISGVDTQNNQILNNAESQNVQIQANEQNANNKNALSFEARQQTAESITEENVRTFLDFNRKVGVENFNDERRQNTINKAFENFDLDAEGNLVTKDGYRIDNYAYKNPGLAMASSKKKSEAENGGLINMSKGSLNYPKQKLQDGGEVPISKNGLYDYPEQTVKVPTKDGKITMKGIKYPVLGIANTGEEIMMQPEKEYHFKGATEVLELPQLKKAKVKAKKSKKVRT